MSITHLPSDVLLHIESYINDIIFLGDLIFINKYFRQVFISRLNSKTLNDYKLPYNSYTYYSSKIKEKIYHNEYNKYKLGYKKSVMYNGVEVGWIEKSEYYWKCFVLHDKYKIDNFYNKDFSSKMKMDIGIHQIYHVKNRIVIVGINKTHLPNPPIKYFTKDMAMDQVIYHHNQLSK